MNNPIEITRDELRRRPLPRPDEQGDKDTRGRVLVVGGALQMPGALILAGTAALRAGAGKLQLGTCRPIVPHVGIAVPEALVFGLAETHEGGIDPGEAKQVAERASKTEATLVGPGMVDRPAVDAFMRALAANVDGPTLVLDAEAMHVLADTHDALHKLGGNVIVTPHLGEMASLMGIDKEEVAADPLGTARRAAARWRAVVALKGSETLIATPDGEAFCWKGGSVGLATSGSGDTLAGVVAGLAARGASPLEAAVWGVYLHGEAGNVLTQRMGTVGFLARELLDEIPPLMAAFEREQS